MADNSADGINLTRRQAVAALGVGAVVVGGAAAFTAAQVNDAAKRTTDEQVQTLQTQLDALDQERAQAQHELEAANQALESANQQLAAAQLQIKVYQGLFGLYNTLEQVGIDTVATGALNAYKGTLAALETGVDTLKAGIITAENSLNNLENGFAGVREALTRAEAQWANVNALFGNAQQLIAQATSPVLPLIDQAGRFFDDLLAKIPFGAGEGARQTLNGIKGLLVAIPTALDELDDGLFRTLREGWFSDDNARSLQAVVATPITKALLEPARAFLETVDGALNNWEAQVSQPITAAVTQRAVVQKQIAEYKSQNNLA